MPSLYNSRWVPPPRSAPEFHLIDSLESNRNRIRIGMAHRICLIPITILKTRDERARDVPHPFSPLVRHDAFDDDARAYDER